MSPPNQLPITQAIRWAPSSQPHMVMVPSYARMSIYTAQPILADFYTSQESEEPAILI